MIETAWLLLRLTGGVASIQFFGYALFVLLVPWRSGFTSLERGALAFGLGSFGLTLWMLLLTFLQVPYSLASITGPWVLAAIPGLVLAWQRGWLAADCRYVAAKAHRLLTLGRGSERSRAETLLILLLLLAFGFGLLRAMLYPMWSWDALATWGLKAKAFYLAQGVDLSRFEAHNYYPNLAPLLMAYLYFWLGGIYDHLVKALFPLWGGATLAMFYAFLRRLEVQRAWALGAAAFLALNGATFLTHLYIAYADLMLAYYQLAVAGLLLLWLWDEAPAGSGALIAGLSGAMAWSKYEGWPLVMITFLAAFLTLIWLRPSHLARRLVTLLLLGVGGWFFTLPWRRFVALQGLEVGTDHIGGLFLQQAVAGLWSLLSALVWPPYFGLLWPAIFVSFILAGRTLWRTPLLFLGLLLAGNLAGIVLAYALVPASPAEFPLYIRATVDRLLLHCAPAVALIFAVPLGPRAPGPAVPE